MNAPQAKSWTIPAIATAGLIAGILDIASAFVIAVLIGLPIALVVRRFSQKQIINERPFGF
jgi:hypothetical protein